MSRAFDGSARFIDCAVHLMDPSMGQHLMDSSNGQQIPQLSLANLWINKSLDSILLLSVKGLA